MGFPFAPSRTTLRAPASLLIPSRILHLQSPDHPEIPRHQAPGTKEVSSESPSQPPPQQLLWPMPQLPCLSCGPFTQCLEIQHLQLPHKVQPARPASPDTPFLYSLWFGEHFPLSMTSGCAQGHRLSELRAGSQVSLTTMPRYPLCSE